MPLVSPLYFGEYGVGLGGLPTDIIIVDVETHILFRQVLNVGYVIDVFVSYRSMERWNRYFLTQS